MTDDRTDPLDELASAQLDGATSPEEAAQVAGDAELVARVERLARVREALQASEARVAARSSSTYEGRREVGIAAALAAFDDEGRAARIPSTTTVAAARRPAWDARRTRQLIGVAAAVILLALAVPLIGGLGGESDDEQSATALDATESRGDAATSEASERMMGSDEDAAGDVFQETGAAVLPRLGSFDDLSQLTDAVQEQLDAVPGGEAGTGGAEPSTTSTSSSATNQQTTAMAAVPCAAAGSGAAHRFLADLGGQEVVVLVAEQPGGTLAVTVLDAIGCAVVGRADLPAVRATEP